MSEQKHIVIDARELRTSTGRYIERLIHYLQQIDTEHRYTILLYPKDMDGWQPTNPNFHALACPHKEFSFDEQIGYLKQLNTLGADLVHFGMVQQPVRYRGKTVTTMHDLTTIRFRNPSKNAVVFTIKQQVYKWVNRSVAHKSDVIITPTQFVKNDVQAYTGVSADKITVTYESADVITDTPQVLPDLEGQPFIMYIGRPTPHKNLSRLIEAFQTLQTTHRNLKLVLAGKKDALYQAHEQSVQQKGIDGVVFTGFISDGQLRWLYENCQAYVFPSLSEGFGLPGLEAMRHGAPVVSSNATCLPEVYGEAARYFDPLSAADMAGTVSDVLDSPQLRQALVEKGRARVATYSWQRMAEQTVSVYKQVLNES